MESEFQISVQHVYPSVEDLANNVLISKAGPPRLPNRNINHLYHCPVENCSYRITDKAFAKVKYLKQHFKKVHAEKKHECLKCGFKFVTRSLLVEHEKTCGIGYQCHCGAVYKTFLPFHMHLKRKNHNFPGYKYSYFKKGITAVVNNIVSHESRWERTEVIVVDVPAKGRACEAERARTKRLRPKLTTKETQTVARIRDILPKIDVHTQTQLPARATKKVKKKRDKNTSATQTAPLAKKTGRERDNKKWDEQRGKSSDVDLSSVFLRGLDDESLATFCTTETQTDDLFRTGEFLTSFIDEAAAALLEQQSCLLQDSQTQTANDFQDYQGGLSFPDYLDTCTQTEFDAWLADFDLDGADLDDISVYDNPVLF